MTAAAGAIRPLTSRDNPFVRKLKVLSHDGRERRKLSQTVLDGPHLVHAALQAGVGIHAWAASEQGWARDEIRHLIESRPDVPAALLPDALFAQVSPTDSPAGLLAVIDVPQPPGSAPRSGDVLLLDRVQDAGNLGSILRTAAAAGIGQAVLTPGCAQAWSPRVLRAGMGAHFVLHIHEQVDAQRWLAGYQGPAFATSLTDDARSLYDCDLRPPLAWMFGAEGQGLSPELQAGATARVVIPLAPGMESLNVGAAAAICVFEQVRQRQAG